MTVPKLPRGVSQDPFFPVYPQNWPSLSSCSQSVRTLTPRSRLLPKPDPESGPCTATAAHASARYEEPLKGWDRTGPGLGPRPLGVGVRKVGSRGKYPQIRGLKITEDHRGRTGGGERSQENGGVESDDDYDLDSFTEETTIHSYKNVHASTVITTREQSTKEHHKIQNLMDKGHMVRNLENPRINRGDRARSVRTRLINQFKNKGLDIKRFDDIYSFVKSRSVSGEHANPGDIRKRFGKEYEHVAMGIEQLVWFESLDSDNKAKGTT
ncbi:hypothetical protein AAMO2058_000756200 [Amorphochlora amoebiformis]